MQYVKQEVFARLIMYNFCAAVVTALSPHEPEKANCITGTGNTDSELEEEKKESVKKVGIAFSQAVTVCRKLLVNNGTVFIRNAIEAIRAHTYESKAGRSYTRNVKPKSYKPFNHKPG